MRTWKDESARAFNLKAYPDSIPDMIENILKQLPTLREYAYILHNNDIDDNGQIKKPHYHIYLKFTKKLRYTTIAKAFNIAANSELISAVKDSKKLVRYFVHLDDLEKFQYPLEQLTTYNINRDSVLALNFLDSEEKEKTDFQTILEYIAVNEPTLWALVKFCLDNDCISTYRRCYNIFKDLLKEIKEESYLD